MKFFIKSFLLIQFLFSFSLVKGQSSLVDSLFHPDSLRHIVEVLASDSLNGRFTGTPENFKAALFIGDEFGKAGLSHVAGNNGFFQEVKPAWFNVIGAIKGKSKPEQLIIFPASKFFAATVFSSMLTATEGLPPILAQSTTR